MTEQPQIPQIAAKAAAEVDKNNPQNWKEAIQLLASSRLGMIKIEGAKAASEAAKKIALLVGAAVGLLLAWIALMGGLTGLLASFTAMNWWQALLAIAAFHLLIAIVLLMGAKSPGSEPFPITRREFEKDREWLNQLNSKK